jgi:hypothetical protein
MPGLEGWEWGGLGWAKLPVRHCLLRGCAQDCITRDLRFNSSHFFFLFSSFILFLLARLPPPPLQPSGRRTRSSRHLGSPSSPAFDFPSVIFNILARRSYTRRHLLVSPAFPFPDTSTSSSIDGRNCIMLEFLICVIGNSETAVRAQTKEMPISLGRK